MKPHNPDCPRCRSDGDKHVSLVILLIQRDGRERADWFCAVCAHAWSVIAPPTKD